MPTEQRPSTIDRHSWVDLEQGTVDRRIFSEPEIYQAELSRIFARAWNFICHESQLPEQGNFFLNYIGEDQVIAVRDRKDRVQVLLNSCPHRGNTVCRAEQGKTNSFFCLPFCHPELRNEVKDLPNLPEILWSLSSTSALLKVRESLAIRIVATIVPIV